VLPDQEEEVTSRRRLAVLTSTAGLVLGAVPFLQAASAADGTLPADYPAAGCFTLSDPKGDAQFVVQGSVKAPNDPDLDILGVALETTDTSLKAYVKVDALSDTGPALADGHRYTLDFTFNKHVFSAAGSDYGSGTGIIRDGLAQTGQAGHTTQLGVDVPSLTAIPPQTDKGFQDSGLKFTFDYTNSWVVIDLPIADIEKYGGASFDGAGLTAVDVKSATDAYAVSSQWDTTIKDNGLPPSADVWNVGTNTCFGPPAAVLTNAGVTTSQFGDTAKVSAKLTDAAGKPLAGKPVTFAVGSATASATTGTDGVAAAALRPAGDAGDYSLVTAFAGDDVAGASSLSTPFAVTLEKTVLKLTESKAKKPVVTATLRDDDHQALAGQKIRWLVNGKKAGSATTTKAGTAKLTGVVKGQKVRAVFSAVKGEYAAASAKRTVS
jgi:hypothetical protein